MCTLVFSQPEATQFSYRFENLTDEDGIRGLNVACMAQDALGYIWIGTDGGLHRYDGRNFKLYVSNPDDSLSISSNNIQSIAIDQKGIIWLGTRKGLNRYDPDKEDFQRFSTVLDSADILIDKSIRSLFIDSQNNLWVGASGMGLLKFNTVKKEFENWYEFDPKNQNGIPSNHVKAVLEMEGQLILGTDSGISLFDPSNSSFVEISNSANLPNSFVKALYQESKNDVWIGTDKGISLAKFDNGSLVIEPLFPDIEFVKSITEDSDDNVWIASDNGLFKWIRESDKLIQLLHDVDNEYSLVNNNSRSLLCSKEGIIWIGTAGGVSKYVKSRYPFDVTRRNNSNLRGNISNNYITSVAADKHHIWIGTQNGLNRFNPVSGEVSNYFQSENKNSISNSSIATLAIDQSGVVWVGTENGINSITDRRIKKYLTSTDQKSEFEHGGILSVHIDQSNEIWIGTWDGLLKFDREEDRFIRVLPELIIGRVQDVARDVNGDLWVAKRNGISRIQFNADSELFSHFQTATHDMTSDDIMSLATDNEGIWIGSNGDGLMRFEFSTSKFSNYNTSDGLASNDITSLKLDDSGVLWCGSGQGLTRFDTQTGLFTRYKRSDGLPSDFFLVNSRANSADGKLLFGTADGLISFDPSNTKPFQNQAIPVIEGLKLMSKWLKPGETETLPRSLSKVQEVEFSEHDRLFSFKVNALDMFAGDKVKLAYKLEGYDPDWIESSGDNLGASYHDVGAGSYTFKVRASNGSGIWNDQIQVIQVEIIPPIWKSVWFISLCIFVGAVILGYLIYQKVSRSKALKVALLGEVNKRTLELEEKNRSLHKANIQIKAQNERILAQSKLIDEESDKLAKAFGELRKRNIELEEAIKQLKSTQGQLIESEKMASIGFLAAGLAHELNNPLNFIGGVIGPVKRDIGEIKAILNDQQLKNNSGLFEEMHMLLDHIADGSKKASQIIRNLLDLTPTQKNEGKRKIVVDINELLSACVFLIEKGQSDIKFEMNLEPNLAVLGNAVELNQVFINIIKNSIDALQSVDKPVIIIEGGVENGKIKLSFKDNGGGMDELVISNIYEPFYTTKGPGKGTGLGLYISRSIIMKHSGEIDVLSVPDEGTEFVISLERYEN